jgi:surface protein
MSQTFNAATAFHQNPATRDTCKVEFMFKLFEGASSLNQPLLNTWDTSKVCDMDWNFLAASAFNESLSTWNVGCVENSVNNSCLKAGTERLL